ncbi:hypothetical protein BSKO_00187 [Bryopsis sp. KO-2023]|nr:hypothetical protein BSKO_00187 [Bryopsis sp. KO-2023]
MFARKTNVPPAMEATRDDEGNRSSELDAGGKKLRKIQVTLRHRSKRFGNIQKSALPQEIAWHVDEGIRMGECWEGMNCVPRFWAWLEESFDLNLGGQQMFARKSNVPPAMKATRDDEGNRSSELDAGGPAPSPPATLESAPQHVGSNESDEAKHYAARVSLFHEQKQKRRYFGAATGLGRESAVKEPAQMLARQVQDALKAKENADAPVSVLNAELTATKNAMQQAKAGMDEENPFREEVMEAVAQPRGATYNVGDEVASAQHNAES